MNQIKQILCKKLNDYEKMKVKVDKSLKKAPKGSLVLSSSHGMVQYYFCSKICILAERNL